MGRAEACEGGVGRFAQAPALGSPHRLQVGLEHRGKDHGVVRSEATFQEEIERIHGAEGFVKFSLKRVGGNWGKVNYQGRLKKQGFTL